MLRQSEAQSEARKAKQTGVLPRMPRPALEEDIQYLKGSIPWPVTQVTARRSTNGGGKQARSTERCLEIAYVLAFSWSHTSAHQSQSAGWRDRTTLFYPPPPSPLRLRCAAISMSPRNHAEPYGENSMKQSARTKAPSIPWTLSPYSGKTSDGVRWRPRARGACIE